MLRHARILECSAEDYSCSAAIRRSRTGEARSIDRAKIILARLEARQIQQVARELTITIPNDTR